MNHTITLYRSDKCWMAHHTEPHIIELFGSPEIPTAFRSSAPASVVVKELKALNPHYEVVLREGEAA